MEYKNQKIAPSTNRSERLDKHRKNSFRSASVPVMDSFHTVQIGGSRSENILNDSVIDIKSRDDGSKYRYKKTIGRGGMKMVLQVHDNDTLRDVAMALLPDVSTRSKLEIGQFLREARITAGLEHPNIVPVHDIGMDSAGSPYFTMKLLRGETLASVLKKLNAGDPEMIRIYTFNHLIRIYLRICNAITFAHSKGVLHLDLKPENVQVGEYGEVLVLDWGLAKKIHPNSGGNQVTTKTRKIKRLERDSADDSVKGTPGYMAPEQIHSSGLGCSCQTDIYSLGAILYAIVTYQNPIRSADVDQMLQDTVSGNFERPSQREPEREIPYGIEAVIMKAMSLDPRDRYSSVKELRDEVSSFIDGFDTKAEKAGILKKTVLFIRRHKLSCISGIVILWLCLLLGLFFLRDAHRTRSHWIPGCTIDFLQQNQTLEPFTFRDFSFSTLSSSWGTRSIHGYQAAQRQWMFFPPQASQSVKVKVALAMAERHQGEFEMIFAIPTGARKELTKATPIYSFLLSRTGNEYYAALMKMDSVYSPAVLTSRTFPVGKKIELIEAELENGSFVLQINGEIILKTGRELENDHNLIYAGIRSGFENCYIRELGIYRLALPLNSSPLLAGDTLLQEGLYVNAVQRYLMVAKNRPRSRLAEPALKAAYLTARTYLPEYEALPYLLEIKKIIASSHPHFAVSALVEADACAAWKKADYPLALSLIRKSFELDPGTRIVSKILQLPHKKLPGEVVFPLFNLIRRSRHIKALDLSGFGLTSLHGIAGMPLRSLDCSGNHLTSLESLAGMPLESLNCSGNRLTSLKGIEKMPLRSLDCSDNELTALDELKQLPLRSLKASGNPASSLSVLLDMKGILFSEF